MKPFMMKFRHGNGLAERNIYVNMNQVCHITPDGAGCIMTFPASLGNEPAYICVNESPDEIAAALDDAAVKSAS